MYVATSTGSCGVFGYQKQTDFYAVVIPKDIYYFKLHNSDGKRIKVLHGAVE